MSRAKSLSTVLIEEFDALPKAADCPGFDLEARRAALAAEFEAIPEKDRTKKRDLGPFRS